MANWHARTGAADGNSFSIVYHIPIPSANNRVGVNYRTAVINSGLGGTTVLPDGDGSGGTISAAEKTLVTTGAVFEVVETIDTNPGETAAQLEAKVDARYAALVTIWQDRLAKQLTYYGYTKS